MKRIFGFQEFDPVETASWNILRGLTRALLVAAILFGPALVWVTVTALGRIPAVGYVVAVFSLAYLPLYLRRREPAIRVDQDGHVEVRSLGAVPNSRLLRASLINLISFIISATLLSIALWK